MLGREIEVIAGAGDVEIRVGVEPVDEGRTLIAQIALDLEIGVEAEGELLAVLQVAAEFAVQRRFLQVSDVRRHPRDRQPALRPLALEQIIAAAPIGIGHDRLAADLVKGDVLG